MNINSKFLNEAIMLEARWKKAGLLDGIKNDLSRKDMAVSMECQRLHNETGNWDCCDDCKEKEKAEKASEK